MLPSVFGQIPEVIGRCQCAGIVVIVDVVAFVDGLFILVVRTGIQVAAADAAFVAVRLDHIDVDIVGMVVVVDAQPASHDSVFGDFAVQQNFNHDIEGHAGCLEGFVKFDGLVLVARKSVQEPPVLAVISLAGDRGSWEW